MNLLFRPRLRAGYLLAGALVAAGLLVHRPRPTPPTRPSASTSPLTNGTPTYRASGWIYGMTENGAGPPDNFFTDVKFRPCGPAAPS